MAANPFTQGTDVYKFFEALNEPAQQALINNKYAVMTLPVTFAGKGGLDAALKDPKSFIFSGPAASTGDYAAWERAHPRNTGDSSWSGFLKSAVPIVASAFAPGAGEALGSYLGVSNATGAALASAGVQAAAGQDLEQIATNAAISGASSAAGSNAAQSTGSAPVGQIVGGTTAGLLSGKDLETSLANAAISTTANQTSKALTSPSTDPSMTYTRESTPLEPVDYSLGGMSTGGGLGLTGSLAPLDTNNLYSLGLLNTNNGTGLTGALAPLDMSNPYSLETNYGNIGGMGGGLGITTPAQEGATLGSIGAEAEAQANTATTANSAEQKLLSNIIKSALTGTIGSSLTGTGNMATTNPQDTSNAALTSLLGGLLGGTGNLMQGSTNVAARQAQADALRAAGQQAATSSQFRPVGTTTRFGSSNFQVDPATGQLVSAGYNASPLAQGYQDQLAGMTSQGLMQGQQIQGLANQYLGESPEAVRQRYMDQQNALLAPGNEQKLAEVRNNLFQTGRQGLATGATAAGDMAATNPEMAAYYNSIANQQRQIAAGADTAAQNQIKFGQGLAADAYSPFTAGFGAQGAVDKLAQQPLGLSADLAAQFQKANAQGGAFNLNAQNAATQAMLPANQYNPYASLLSGASGSSQLTGALGGLLGGTSTGSALGSWLSGLGVGTDTWTGSPTGLDTSNIDYDYLSTIYSGGNPYAGTTWDGE